MGETRNHARAAGSQTVLSFAVPAAIPVLPKEHGGEGDRFPGKLQIKLLTLENFVLKM